MIALFLEIWMWVLAAGALGFGAGLIVRRQRRPSESLEDLRLSLDTAETHIAQRDREIDTLRLHLRELRDELTKRERDGAPAPAAEEKAQVPSPDTFADAAPADSDPFANFQPNPTRRRTDEPPPAPAVAEDQGPDDLKQIAGIGPLVERALNGLGISRFRQIVILSEILAARSDAFPDFAARGAREGWAAQARTLHEKKYGAPPPG